MLILKIHTSHNIKVKSTLNTILLIFSKIPNFHFTPPITHSLGLIFSWIWSAYIYRYIIEIKDRKCSFYYTFLRNIHKH